MAVNNYIYSFETKTENSVEILILTVKEKCVK
jgi:hypothetical protein